MTEYFLIYVHSFVAFCCNPDELYLRYGIHILNKYRCCSDGELALDYRYLQDDDISYP